jgi:cephalosporin hydroxylase
METNGGRGAHAIVRRAGRAATWRLDHALGFVGGFGRSVLAGMSLRRRARHANTPGEALELTKAFRAWGLGIPAHQVTSEVEPFLAMIARERPRTVVEIGSAEGGSLFLWSRAASESATIVSIDHPAGRWGGGRPIQRLPLHRSLARKDQRLKLFRRDSHDPSMPARLRRFLRKGEVDFLFIDGDHTYEGVRLDYEMYRGFVRTGGFIAFHDVNHPDDDDVGVQKFWLELKANAQACGQEVREFIDPARGKGIGVIRAG